MFDASFPELLVVFVTGLLVLGPERLPKVARTAGRWVGRARAMFMQVRSELEREANFQELQAAQRELRQSLEDGGKALSEEVKSASDAVDAAAKTVESETDAKKTAPGSDHGSTRRPAP